jgi:flagellar biosynthesis protein FlhA
MPNLVFLTIAAACAGFALRLKRRAEQPVTQDSPPSPPPPLEARELSWEDVRPIDMVGLEVGYRLVPLVDRNQGGDLLGRIRGVRRKLTQELGFLVQAVHIRDNLELGPNVYRISLAGVPLGEGSVHPERELAINSGRVFGPLNGIATRDPAFGMEAVWIETALRDHAQSLGYAVVDASTVIATHLSQLLQLHAHELFGHEEAEQLLRTLAKTTPKLVEDLVPKTMPLATVVRVMQGLLAERVSIRNVRAIVEVLVEAGPRTQDTQALIAQVRIALGRQIVQSIVGIDAELPVITLDPELERLLSNSLSAAAAGPGLEPGLAERLQEKLAEAVQRQERGGEPAVLLTPPLLRGTLARFFRVSVPSLHVLAWNELPEARRVRLVTALGR